jgi:hypothetical protein
VRNSQYNADSYNRITQQALLANLHSPLTSFAASSTLTRSEAALATPGNA